MEHGTWYVGNCFEYEKTLRRTYWKKRAPAHNHISELRPAAAAPRGGRLGVRRQVDRAAIALRHARQRLGRPVAAADAREADHGALGRRQAAEVGAEVKVGPARPAERVQRLGGGRADGDGAADVLGLRGAEAEVVLVADAAGVDGRAAVPWQQPRRGSATPTSARRLGGGDSQQPSW